MKKCVYGLMSIVAFTSMFLIGTNVLAGEINFSFVFGNPASPSGTGTFYIANDPGIGTFVLNSIGSFTISFDIGAHRFTQANITSDTSENLVVITPFSPGIEQV